ncbi:hypothetical protein [Glycomyces sp. MUSA5-2]|uniref:hypothetical protein n=1 Tax=Glycomyces sp. MUSA5-2 TaxID=2053002 RepID=UPI003009793E
MKETRFGRQPAHAILKYKGYGAIEKCAVDIEVNRMSLRDALLGRHRPGMGIRERLPEYLGVPLEELFTEESLGGPNPLKKETEE